MPGRAALGAISWQQIRGHRESHGNFARRRVHRDGSRCAEGSPSGNAVVGRYGVGGEGLRDQGIRGREQRGRRGPMSESIRDILAREADEAEARAEAEDRGEITPAPGQRGRKRAVDPSQVYAVRIPVSRLEELRGVAGQLDTPPTTLI